MKAKRDQSNYVARVKSDLEAQYKTLAVFRRPRGAALYHYFAVLEVEVVKLGLFAGDPGKKLFAAGRAAVESSFRAIPALFERCPTGDASPAYVSREIFAEAHQLFEYSYKYEQVMYNLQLAERGHFQIFIAKRDSRITFAYSSADADAMETRLRSGELFRRLSGRHSESIANKSEALLLIQQVRTELEHQISRVAEEAIEYRYTDSLVAAMKAWAQQLSASISFELPDNTVLWQISFADVRRF